MEHDEYVGVEEAARRCGVSTDSIRRRLRAGRLPGARRAGTSIADPWLIPVGAFQHAGLRPVGTADDDTVLACSSAELAVCRAELALAHERISHLTALLEEVRASLEHERALADEQRTWLSCLVAGATPGTEVG